MASEPEQTVSLMETCKVHQVVQRVSAKKKCVGARKILALEPIEKRPKRGPSTNVTSTKLTRKNIKVVDSSKIDTPIDNKRPYDTLMD